MESPHLFCGQLKFFSKRNPPYRYPKPGTFYTYHPELLYFTPMPMWEETAVTGLWGLPVEGDNRACDNSPGQPVLWEDLTIESVVDLSVSVPHRTEYRFMVPV